MSRVATKMRTCGGVSSARLLGAVTAMLVLAACTPSNLFVLLPDDEGNVGSIQVSNEAGSQLLDEAGQATGVNRAGEELDAPFKLEEDEIRQAFGEVLDAQPEPPVTFLLYFRTGTAELTAESQALIPEVLETIRNRQVPPNIAVVGHTDTLGSAAVNVQLSLNRARAVQTLLLGENIREESVELSSHGENNPLVETEDNVSEPRNRRVEITIR